MIMDTILLGAMGMMSLLSFCLMGIDKGRAKRGAWRISEKTLLCAAALFGHTHVAMMEEKDGLLILNPGSVSRPRNGKASFAVLETDGEKLKAVIVDWIN